LFFSLCPQPAAKTLLTPPRWNRVNSLTAFLFFFWFLVWIWLRYVFCYLCYVSRRPDIWFSGQLNNRNSYRSTSLQVTLLGRRVVSSCYLFCSRTDEDGSKRKRTEHKPADLG
ncbi:uncharacterized protein BO87DRAFT_362303, partial [Aspergillus neoniger CBS 115656]